MDRSKKIINIWLCVLLLLFFIVSIKDTNETKKVEVEYKIKSNINNDLKEIEFK